MINVSISRVARWNIRENVSDNRNIVFNIKQNVSINRNIVFNVKSLFNFVAIERLATWNIKQNVSNSRTTTWIVQAAYTPPAAPIYVPPSAFPDFPSVDPFDRVHIDFLVHGQTRVSWSLSSHFFEPLPYTFQLQFGKTGLNKASDWINVGSPVVNTFFQTDTNRRWYGKTQYPHYRIKLTTGNGKVFFSKPATILGDLNWRDWRIAQEIIRKEQLRHSQFTSVGGFLLKQKRSGPKCYRCVDRYTDEPRDSHCPVCYGTRWVGGYYKPLDLFYADLSPEQSVEKRNLQKVGMEKPVVISARFIGTPQIYAQDLWVNPNSDARYIIGGYKINVHIKQVPIVITAELKLLPPDDVAYLINIEEI